MAENRREITETSNDLTIPTMHITNPNENSYTQESSNTRYSLLNMNPGATLNFDVRTMEHSRTFTDNISSTIEGIRPLIQQAAVCINRLYYVIYFMQYL
jgi:hypothetical protein